MSIQQQVIKALHVKPVIQAKEEIRQRVDFLKAYCRKTRAKGFVLGISGGQDSTLAGRLAQLAVEELRAEDYEATFYAVRLPYGTQQDEEDAAEALAFIRPDQSLVVNIQEPVLAFSEQVKQSFGHPMSDFNKGNAKARMRMMVQYAIGGETGCLVIGTDHAAEAVTGFYTKFGDGGADLVPLAGLTKEQGRELLKELNATERLYLKVPTADLLDDKPQQSDEAELGITYKALDDYLTGAAVDAKTEASIEERYLRSEHKRQMPVAPYDEWWK
ncbi:ammonia-dependent NAD(+) synthetase [Paenibacillus lutimineralis]|uniref:NH(3)-dependent NAD(+) synthetase n=1 Tax=Paenibacillus lutimineralis TaxID=2707005 RepID=A0A3S9UVM6_9BACL|nr:ammonia-dependent NAD(+) synthetase [Paenibacillus lutimineralis]AZS14382.1 ammonia-dependent NAD(+) synthetase [Paenibacillus lutimineralis]